MSKIIEKVEKLSIPAAITRGLIVFPEINLGFEIMNRPKAVKAVERAQSGNGLIFLVSQNDPETETPKSAEDIYKIGTVAKVKQSIKLPDGNMRILVEGIARAELLSCDFSKDFCTCEVLKKNIFLESDGGIKSQAIISEAMKVLDRYARYIPRFSNELVMILQSIKNPGLFADFVATNIYLNFERKQRLLEEFDPYKRLELLCVYLQREIEVLEVEEQIHKRVKGQIDKNQRDYFLREQLKALQTELGEDAENPDNEIEQYEKKLSKLELESEVREKIGKEIARLKKTPSNSPESTVIRNYLDLCFEVPWNKKTKDSANIFTAERILNEDHDGLDKVKERILEFVAVKQNQPELRGQILCLAGPPGVGKTSIAASVARALNRKYTRVSLGGVRDEADIRGHRRTYIGSMPGRIINAVKDAGVLNPLILLDEVDKLGQGAHGDPSAALLEVLDSEQNKAFRDHFLELPLDLSDCMFIATANMTDLVPRPLLDRMEVIQITSYTRDEKHAIAENHLVGKQVRKHGLNKSKFKITDDALYELIDYYTREAGVRNLERELASLCRKAVKKMLTDGRKSITVNIKVLVELLGHRKFKEDEHLREDSVGVVNGLAWTAMGGDLLQVEVVTCDGTGKIELTGSLGDVMKESARTAISFIRSVADKYNIDREFYKNKDIHIHFPEGAVPKDGPSAGITIATAIFSQLTGYPVRSDVAMTGEISLRGRVLPIGGLKEKTVAAHRSKIKDVIIPEVNMPDLDEIDEAVRGSLNFIPVKNAEKVFENAVIFPTDKPIQMLCAQSEQAEKMDRFNNYMPVIPDTMGIGRITDIGENNGQRV